MILIVFVIGFMLGLAYSLIGEKLPLLIPEVKEKDANSWILNLFIAVINAIILLISYYEYGFSYEMFAAMVLAGLVIIIFVSDFKYLIILDSPLIISGIFVLIIKYIYLYIESRLFFVVFIFVYLFTLSDLKQF